MRSIEDKGCYNNGADIPTSNACSFEFPRGSGKNRSAHHRTAAAAALGAKPTPSKWDDAQKWLVGMSRKGAEKRHPKTKPRNSNADDTRLIAPVPHKENDSSGSEDEGGGDEKPCPNSALAVPNETAETKNVDYEESFWRVNKPAEVAMRSICVRDMGTEMTPIGSQEPSRAATPIRSTTPIARSPIPSGSSTPVRCPPVSMEGFQPAEIKEEHRIRSTSSANEKMDSEQGERLSPLESRAVAWDEAERAKYTARYKREEVRIQAWENHEKRKAEMEIRRMEAKAERMKSRAQEKCVNKLASVRRVAEERRASAEAKLHEKAARTSERADYIRRTGRLPSSFSFKWPSWCW